MKILVTGAAGFIGSAVSKKLLERGEEVVGIDNLNDYYAVSLKQDRLKALEPFEQFSFKKLDLADRSAMELLFKEEAFERVVHLGAQAGVRYSIDNPHAYMDSNILGTMNVLEGCRHNKVAHLVYASSSSVYGANETMPFSVHDNVDHPLSLYAATKKSNELMAHTYSHLYKLPTTGLRFFTVYGPWGRPDMAPIKFAKAISEGKAIDVYNYGKHRRDFTYIDDIVSGTILAMDNVVTGNEQWSGIAPDPGSSKAPWRVYNIGNSEPVELMTFIETLEKYLGVEAQKNMLPMQPGDVEATYADVRALQKETGYQPSVSIDQGIKQFIEWFKNYYS
jgi:UDP-glucuronate 4-epimerase